MSILPLVPGAKCSLGTPTGITDEFRRDQALQVVDSEGEILFFDRSKLAKSQQLYDADAAHMQRWIMLRSAQQILSQGAGHELRVKQDRAFYCAWMPDFVGPRWRFDAESMRSLSAGDERGLRASVTSYRYTTLNKLDADGEVVQHLQPKFRTVLCLQRRVSGRMAEVWQAPKSGQASWHNLQVCGSPWTCAICARRISLGRQEQIRKIYDAALSQEVGGCAYMLTFTVRHGIGDDCAELVSKMKEAMQFIQDSAAWKHSIRRQPLKRPRVGSMPYLGYIGRIAALEVTYGANGWHPHEHHLWFFKNRLSGVQVRELKTRLFDAWAFACVKAGLAAPLAKFGLDVRIALSAAEYLAKFGDLDGGRSWGPEKEIASSHSKRGNKKGRSPMQILWDASQCDNLDDFDAARPFDVFNRDAHLFFDFANAFLGRHQLQLSRTLKTWLRSLGVDLDETEQGDLALAEALEDESQFQFDVSNHDFLTIVRNKAQGSVLAICKAQGVDAALEFIAGLPGRVVDHDASDWRGFDEAESASLVLMPARRFFVPDAGLPRLIDTPRNAEYLEGADLHEWYLHAWTEQGQRDLDQIIQYKNNI